MSAMPIKAIPRKFYVSGNKAILEVEEKKMFGAGETYKVCVNNLVAMAGLKQSQLTPELLKGVLKSLPKKIIIVVTEKDAVIQEQAAFRNVLISVAKSYGSKKIYTNIEDL